MAHWVSDVTNLPDYGHSTIKLNHLGSWMQFCYDELRANSFIENCNSVMYAIQARGNTEVLVGIFNKMKVQGFVQFPDDTPALI